MDFNLKDKVVLITGGSKGIGKAAAQAFASEGARVAVSARGLAELRQAAADIGGQTLAVGADVTNLGDVERMVREVTERFGTIHVLVNNAGGALKTAPFGELTDADWLQVVDLNLLSAVRVSRAVIPHMQRQKWGRIINVSTAGGEQPDGEMPAYNAAKAALNNLTKSLSKAYARDGILVNTISPAMTKSPRLEQRLRQVATERGISIAEAEEYLLALRRSHNVLRRAARTEEVAHAIVFLAGDGATFITGTNLRVDAGSVAAM